MSFHHNGSAYNAGWLHGWFVIWTLSLKSSCSCQQRLLVLHSNRELFATALVNYYWTNLPLVLLMLAQALGAPVGAPHYQERTAKYRTPTSWAVACEPAIYRSLINSEAGLVAVTYTFRRDPTQRRNDSFLTERPDCCRLHLLLVRRLFPEFSGA